MTSIDKMKKQFQSRVDRIKQWDPPVRELFDKLPEIPLNYTPKDDELAAINLGLFIGNTSLVATRTSSVFTSLWENNHFITISLHARFLYELWGATYYASNTFLRMEQTGDTEAALMVLQRLTTGTRYSIELPWGGLSNFKSLHVLDLIRELDNTHPKASDVYNYLCESCHPSFIQLSYWGLIERNHENEKFFGYAKEMLNRTLEGTESAQAGITSDVVTAVDLCQRYISR